VTSFRDRTVEEFLAAVAARRPAPSGGAVAAITVAAAAGLVAMAARFSPDGASGFAEDADAVRLAATDLADADADAYGEVLAAYRLTRDDPRRHRRIRIALEGAADVPLRIAEAGARVARTGVAVAAGGNPNLVGDVRTGVVLAAGASRAAAELVRINVELGDLDRRIAAAAANAAATASGAVRQVVGADVAEERA
jgi:methenyltetrahydrofolate cyclohydrolase